MLGGGAGIGFALFFLTPFYSPAREADFSFVGVDAQDFYFQFISDFYDVLGVLDFVIGKLRNV